MYFIQGTKNFELSSGDSIVLSIILSNAFNSSIDSDAWLQPLGTGDGKRGPGGCKTSPRKIESSKVIIRT